MRFPEYVSTYTCSIIVIHYSLWCVCTRIKLSPSGIVMYTQPQCSTLFIARTAKVCVSSDAARFLYIEATHIVSTMRVCV